MGGAQTKTQTQVEQTVPPATLDALRVIAAAPNLTYQAATDAVNDILSTYSIVITAQDIEAYRLSQYAGYFLNSRTSIVQLETVEISHSAFSKTYRIVRNATKGITAIIEGGGTAVFDYYPMKLSPQHARDDLDHGITVTFGDLGEILPLELDRVMNAPGGMEEKPVVIYRVYRSDDLTFPLYGPLKLEVEAFSFDRYGSTFEAKAPAVNYTRTGEIYSLTRFPGLRGFL